MPLEATDLAFVSELVERRSAIVLTREKDYLVEARLLPLALREGLSSVSELVGSLRKQPMGALHEKVVEAMITNETSFFRDLKPFEALRKIVLPEIVRERAEERRIQIWCGACSTGQEPYSIAIILKEHFAKIAGWKIEIIATDLSTESLARAAEGRYSQLEVSRGLPANLLTKYFHRDGLEWHVKDEIKRLVHFRRLNLIDSAWNIGSTDVVFLRNVLIYFDVATKKAILQKIRRVLQPGGYLFLGGGETTFDLDDAYERISFERGSCYRLRAG